MKWTKDKLDLFFAMKEEGCSIEEICNALGCERQAVYDKTKSLIKMNGGRMPKSHRRTVGDAGPYKNRSSDDYITECDKNNDKGDKAMSKYPEKTAKADAAEVWRMFDEGKTRKEIAEHFGVSVQTICNRITAGRPKAEKVGNISASADDVGTDVLGGPVTQFEEPAEAHNADPSKWQEFPVKDDGPAAIDEKYEESGDTEMMKNTEDAIMNTVLGGKTVETSADERTVEDAGPYKDDDEKAPSTSEEKSGAYVDATKPGIIDLAFKARHIAHDAGFEPDHLMINASEVRDEIIVSGKGADGKVYEIQYSVTNPIYFSRYGGTYIPRERV